MIGEVLFACVLLVTHGALVRSLTRVPHVVVDVMLFAGERLLAYVTPMWRFAGVFAHMIVHVLLASESFRAVLTPERRLTGVTAKVIVQVLFAGKCLLADAAPKRLVC